MAKSPTAETKEVEEQETAAAGAPQVSPATQTPVGKPPLEITGEYKQWPQPYKFRKPLERPSAELQAKVAALNEATGLEWVAKSTAKGGPPCFTAVTKYTPQKAALLCRAFADTSLMPHEGNQWMNLRFWMQDETLVFILPLADNEKMTPEKLAQAARRYEACSFALEKHRIDSKNIICLDPQEPNPSSFRQIHSVLHPEEDRDEWWPQVLNQLLAPLNIPHQTVGDLSTLLYPSTELRAAQEQNNPALLFTKLPPAASHVLQDFIKRLYTTFILFGPQACEISHLDSSEASKLKQWMEASYAGTTSFHSLTGRLSFKCVIPKNRREAIETLLQKEVAPGSPLMQYMLENSGVDFKEEKSGKGKRKTKNYTLQFTIPALQKESSSLNAGQATPQDAQLLLLAEIQHQLKVCCSNPEASAFIKINGEKTSVFWRNLLEILSAAVPDQVKKADGFFQFDFCNALIPLIFHNLLAVKLQPALAPNQISNLFLYWPETLQGFCEYQAVFVDVNAEDRCQPETFSKALPNLIMLFDSFNNDWSLVLLDAQGDKNECVVLRPFKGNHSRKTEDHIRQITEATQTIKKQIDVDTEHPMILTLLSALVFTRNEINHDAISLFLDAIKNIHQGDPVSDLETSPEKTLHFQTTLLRSLSGMVGKPQQQITPRPTPLFEPDKKTKPWYTLKESAGSCDTDAVVQALNNKSPWNNWRAAESEKGKCWVTPIDEKNNDTEAFIKVFCHHEVLPKEEDAPLNPRYVVLDGQNHLLTPAAWNEDKVSRALKLFKTDAWLFQQKEPAVVPTWITPSWKPSGDFTQPSHQNKRLAQKVRDQLAPLGDYFGIPIRAAEDLRPHVDNTAVRRINTFARAVGLGLDNFSLSCSTQAQLDALLMLTRSIVHHQMLAACKVTGIVGLDRFKTWLLTERAQNIVWEKSRADSNTYVATFTPGHTTAQILIDVFNNTYTCVEFTINEKPSVADEESKVAASRPKWEISMRPTTKDPDAQKKFHLQLPEFSDFLLLHSHAAPEVRLALDTRDLAPAMLEVLKKYDGATSDASQKGTYYTSDVLNKNYPHKSLAEILTLPLLCYDPNDPDQNIPEAFPEALHHYLLGFLENDSARQPFCPFIIGINPLIQSPFVAATTDRIGDTFYFCYWVYGRNNQPKLLLGLQKGAQCACIWLDPYNNPEDFSLVEAWVNREKPTARISICEYSLDHPWFTLFLATLFCVEHESAQDFTAQTLETYLKTYPLVQGGIKRLTTIDFKASETLKNIPPADVPNPPSPGKARFFTPIRDTGAGGKPATDFRLLKKPC